jgi:hypothetical protein
VPALITIQPGDGDLRSAATTPLVRGFHEERHPGVKDHHDLALAVPLLIS